MANPNPVQARQARKKRRKPGDTKALILKVWNALEVAEKDLESFSPDTRLKAAHAIFQGAATYSKIFEGSEHEARIAELERLIKTGGKV